MALKTANKQVGPEDGRRASFTLATVCSHGDTSSAADTQFSSYSKFLLWAWRAYGVDLNIYRGDSGRFCKLVTVIMLCVIMTIQATLAILDVGVLVQAVAVKDMSILYFMIPILSIVFYPPCVYLYVFKRKRQLNLHFTEMVKTMQDSFGVGPDRLRTIIRRWECRVAILFFVIYGISFVIHVPIALEFADDPFLQMITNITRSSEAFHLPNSVLFAMHGLEGHVYLVKFLMAATFVVFCLLLTSAFDMLNAEAAALVDADQSSSSSTTVPISEERFEELCSRHKRLCVLVEQANRVFSTFLGTAFGLHILNICFYARCIALHYSWMTTLYHIVVLHVLVTFLFFFAMLCWGALSVNQRVCYLHKKLFYGGNFRSAELKNIKVDLLFYVMNTTANPIQICVFNYFPINWGFIVTVIGTVVTYTVALFSLN